MAAAVLTGLVTVLPGALGTAPAAAAPAPADDADRPVEITLDRLEPRTVTPGAPILVAGTLVNDSDDTFTDLAVRLQRGEEIDSRRALAADMADPDQATAATAPFLPVPGELDPGDSLSFAYTTTAEELRLPEDGVFPALINVNGTRDGGAAERVGELSTYLVAQPPAPVSRTTVAWLWPVTERPHRDATGAFTDDGLAEAIAPDGRLDRVLAVLEELPPAPLPGGPGTVPVTLAINPATVEALSLMAAGPYRFGDDGRAGTGTADAAEFLDRLRALAAVHPVVALPYADVDADGLVSVGLADVLTRTLPGTEQGTARQPARSGGPVATAPATPAAPAGTPTGAAEPTGDAAAGTPVPGDAAGAPAGGDDGTGAGAALLREVLGVEPVTDLAWPAGGAARLDTLEVLQAGGVTEVVLAESALTDGERAVGDTAGTVAAARTTVPAPGGELSVLVADGALAEVVAAAGADPDGARLAEQRYLAELGVLTDQLADEEPAAVQTVLVVPPRLVDADPEWASAMIGDTVTEPWLAATSVGGLATGPSTDAGELVAADRDAVVGSPLPAAGLAEIAETAAVRDDFAAAVAGDPATVLAGYDAALARAGSAAWRIDPAGFADAVADLSDTIADLRDRVTLLAPADGTYSLASNDAPLVLTVQNDLPFAVDVRLDLSARANVGLSTEDVGITRLEPRSRTTIQVPTEVRQSGGFTVTAALTTPAGGPLGEPVQLQVKSTAYGTVTLAITLGAGVLLGLLFLRRLVRFLLRRRRPAVERAEPAAVPPVRSPV
ncbi:DUF6049 family protein [Modestobacter lapidis]